ncbi:DMT family transporter [Fodinicola acaciae]|uniref:DMT family transporter n=1 Tax=Fodinicola acaciae TaxID=2681555 RepID=UPI0013D559CB|nr:DMT family transporter [Fodinicola acaciae]
MISDKVRGGLLCTAAMMLVGSSFPASSLLVGFPYAGGQAMRYAVAAAILLPLAFRRGAPLPARVRPRDWLLLVLLAATGLVGFNFAVLAALRTAEPAVVGVIVGCVPLLLAVIAPLTSGKRPSVRMLAASAVVVAGAAVVQGFGRSDLAGLGFSLLALAGEAAFSLLAVPLLPRLGAIGTSAYSTVVAALEAYVIALVVDGFPGVRVPTFVELLALLWIALPVTVVAFICWYGGLVRIGAASAGLFAGVLPLTTAVVAPLVGTGTFGVWQLVGGLTVAGGLAVGLVGRSRAAKPLVTETTP